MYSTAFWYLFVVLLVFLALLRNHCYSFHRTKWRLVTSICRGPGPVATRMPFFSPKFKSTANFSAPAQEGNIFFLSGRSARKKIHNFPIKSSHLCQAFVQCLWPLSRLPTNLHYDNWHLHDGCQGGNDKSTRLLHCEKASACTRRVSANCHNAKRKINIIILSFYLKTKCKRLTYNVFHCVSVTQ